MTIYMKKYLSFLSILITTLATLTQISSAASNSQVKIALNNAYPKKDGTYTVVVKENHGTKLALYVNDKNPVFATVNKQDWATFRNVRLASDSKLSFTKVFTDKGKTTQKAINYVRYVSAVSPNVAFVSSNPAKPKTTEPTPKVATTPPVASTPAPAPQPSCTNGTYINSAGNTVCRPETVNSAPAGATAACRDGTYSFSQTHSGTCSHHGGVSEWL
jgi:hypothetical protein